MKFRCTKCNYKFEKDKVPLRCPYCGNKETLTKEKTAEELINSEF